MEAARLHTIRRLFQQAVLQVQTKRESGAALQFPKPPTG